MAIVAVEVWVNRTSTPMVATVLERLQELPLPGMVTEDDCALEWLIQATYKMVMTGGWFMIVLPTLYYCIYIYIEFHVHGLIASI